MTWLDLPAALRRRVEVVLQAQVHGFEPAAGGFTVGGVVGVVRGSNDNRLFVKAVGDDNPAADDLLIGTNVAQVLPATVPAPRVRLLINSDRWWLAAFDAVDGHPAREPWDDKELNAVLRALTTSARALTPAPNVQVPTVVEQMAGRYGTWHDLATRGRHGRLSVESLGEWERERLDQFADYENRWPSLAEGPTLLHFDLRHDNCMIDPSGAAMFVDWGRACFGAPWMDLVCLLLESDLNGHDEQTIFDSHPLGQQADDEALDAFLVVLASYWTAQVARPPELGTHRLRARQRYSQAATLRWLTARWSR